MKYAEMKKRLDAHVVLLKATLVLVTDAELRSKLIDGLVELAEITGEQRGFEALIEGVNGKEKLLINEKEKP